MAVTLRRTTGSDAELVALTKALDAELRDEYGAVQDDYAQYNVVDTDTAVVAYVDGVPAGCGCFKRFDGAPNAAELKRMFVALPSRGTGVGRAVLGELEEWARTLGYQALFLETGTRQAGAIKMYERNGYARIPPYGPYVGMEYSICMRKSLA